MAVDSHEGSSFFKRNFKAGFMDSLSIARQGLTIPCYLARAFIFVKFDVLMDNEGERGGVQEVCSPKRAGPGG